MAEKPLNVEEVWEAIQTCGKSKVPRLDGFNMKFIKSYWRLLKSDIMDVFDKFFSAGEFDKRIDKSFFVLIPKIKSPTNFNEFIPIFLVGCLYKIMAKVMVRKLQRVIGVVIGDCQFSFIKGRQILDCALVSNEIVNSVRRQGNDGLLFKVDFERAYNSVSWGFLDFIQKKMGFGERWGRWVYYCISIVSLFVLVNGSPSREFDMKKGLWQGCPLYQLLFNIVGEAFNPILKKATEINLCEGLQISREGRAIPHLLFADNTIICYESNLSQIENVKKVL